MSKPLQIGITGGIGSGKSLICRIFQCLGVSVYDADSRAKYVMTTDGILISQIKKEFGDLSFGIDGNLNRKYLSETVFNDPEKLSILNGLVHPRVRLDWAQWVEEHRGEPYLLREAALLFEAGASALVDKVIVVSAPEELRIARVLRRDSHRTADQVKEIMQRQWPEEEKVKRADFVIHNDERALVVPQVIKLHHLFLGSAEDHR